MAILETRQLEAKFTLQDSVVHALRGIDLNVEDGEFFVLLGPSGCGKTTMLRSIAGLERPTTGTIRIDGEVVFDSTSGIIVPPDKRPIAMVFQSYAIWPHMDVFENIAFPLRRGRTKMADTDIKVRVGEVLEMLGMGDMANRPVTTLSGGQQQRVALARALALRPRVLLMDEPLSNLDLKLQIRLRSQMRDLMHELGLTTIHVTHNQAEALETGDRIAVMEQGRIVQLDQPRVIYHRPENEFVARFLGDMNIYQASFDGEIADEASIRTPFGNFKAQNASKTSMTTGDNCVFGIRPEDIEIVDDGETQNSLTGTVIASDYVGEGFVHTVDAVGQSIRVKCHHDKAVNKGDTVGLRFPPNHTVIVTPARGLVSEDLEGGLAGEGASRAG